MFNIHVDSTKIVMSIDPSSDGSAKRLPNGLIWDINTLLSEKYTLYEIFTASNEKRREAIKIRNWGWNRYLCFERLSTMYIEHENPKESSYMQEFLKYVDDFDDYHDFFETFSMEAINGELIYVATDDINSTKFLVLESFKQHGSSLHLKKVLCEVVPVLVLINDHDFMELHINDASIKHKIQAICEHYSASQ